MEKKQVPLQREESAKQENQLRSRVQILLQLLVALYLFYLGLVGIAELVQGVSTLHPAVAVGSSLVFAGCAMVITVKNGRLFWRIWWGNRKNTKPEGR